MKRQRKMRPLGQRLFIASLMIGLVVMLGIAALRGLITADNTRKRFMEVLHSEARSHINAIAEALWVFDQKVLSAQIQGIEASPYISYVSVVDEIGQATSAGQRRESGGFELTLPIDYVVNQRSAVIGTFTLQADLDALRELSWSWVAGDLPITALGLALVAAILYMYFEKTVTQRLAEDTRHLAAFTFDGDELPFSLQPESAGSEFETLEKSFNDLAFRLRASYRVAQQARVAAETSERRYEALFDHSPVALCLEDYSDVHNLVLSLQPGRGPGEAEAFFRARPEAVERCAAAVRVLATNSAAFALFGISGGEEEQRAKEEAVPWGSPDIFIGVLAAIARQEKRAFAEGTVRTSRGEELRIEASWEAISEVGAAYARSLIAFVDVTQRVKAQETLSANLREKEALIRELFHRTKNNMQSILSLISFQSWKLKDESLREALRALETRVYSMSLVHRMLYEYNDLSRLSLSAFIREFTAYLSASEDIETRGIRFEQRLEEIEVTIDVAVPLGLIIAELVDNAIRHGFPNRRSGVITIELAWLDDVRIVLTVADDGVGARPGFEAEEDGAMGLQLVESLTESQLGGTVEFDSFPKGGFRCRVTARPDLYSVRV